MEKTKAIIDTCFLQKVSSEGKNPDNIKRIIEELDFAPVTHPYVSEHELGLCSYSKDLVESGYIQKVSYNEFINDGYDKMMYESYFFQLHEDLRKYLEAKKEKKQINKLDLHDGQTIYNTHILGSSMGDVHMILMAAFMKLPIILTQDSDIEVLKILAKKRMSFGSYELHIYDAWDLIKEIAEKEDSLLSKKQLEKILDEMGERGQRSEFRKIWSEKHSI